MSSFASRMTAANNNYIKIIHFNEKEISLCIDRINYLFTAGENTRQTPSHKLFLVFQNQFDTRKKHLEYEMPYRFLAIDFETANYAADSACSIGLVLVEGARILKTAQYLIQPPYRDFVFTHVHGITWQNVASAPFFDEIWTKIAPFFGEIDFLVAHNASFDQKVLIACCQRYQLAPPTLPFQCTVKLARKNLGIYPTNLPSVCRTLSIPLNHHDALSDAIACAKIAIVALSKPSIPEQPTLLM
jgi:DNA polymerase-3 subunit epsilon